METIEKENKDLEKEMEELKENLIKFEQESTSSHQQHETLQAEHQELQGQHEKTSSELINTTKLHEDATTIIATHNESVQAVKKELDDKIVEHRISSRRQKDLIKDLKKSLLKESKQRQELTQQMDSLRDRSDASDHLEERVLALTKELDEAKRHQHDGGGSKPTLPPRGGGSGGGGGVKDDGVTAALAGRLEQLLTENVYVKEKIGMLESIVQDLTSDLADKREQIKKMEKSSTPQKKDGGSNGGGSNGGGLNGGGSNSNSGTPIQRPPNFNLVGSVAFSSPQTRDERGDTLADAIDEI